MHRKYHDVLFSQRRIENEMTCDDTTDAMTRQKGYLPCDFKSSQIYYISIFFFLHLKKHLYTFIKKLVTSFDRAASFSHPLTFNFLWSLGYIRKLVFVSPWGNYFTPDFVCSQHTAPRNI